MASTSAPDEMMTVVVFGSPGSVAVDSAVALPAVTLGEKGAFEELHKMVMERVYVLEEGADGLTGGALREEQRALRHAQIPVLREMVKAAQQAATTALNTSWTAFRPAWLKGAGTRYQAALLLAQVLLLELNLLRVANYADAEGLPTGLLLDQIHAYQDDKEIRALVQAAQGTQLGVDLQALAKALPAGIERYQHYVGWLDEWLSAIGEGARLSRKVVKIANIAMIAISIYQVAKIPVVPGGGAPPPPTAVVGVLPGGAAIGAGVNVANLATVLEALQKLTAIGALDAGVLGGIGMLGGGTQTATPELRRPEAMQMAVVSDRKVPIAGGKGLQGHEDPSKGAGDKGGHTIRHHVAKDDAELADRLRAESKLTVTGSFSDTTTAESFIERVLYQRSKAIKTWLSRADPGVDHEFEVTFTGERTGRTLVRGAGASVDANSVKIVLVRNPRRAEGYYILTAFPLKR